MNRVTFGARDLDVANVTANGWTAWVEDQLRPPAGDDPDLDRYLKSFTVHIQYDSFDDNLTNYHWKGVNEDRPLSYLTASLEKIWKTTRQIPWTVSFEEAGRMEMEFISSVYIRNAHSRYQLREFMTDFWSNHFNVGRAKSYLVGNPLIIYDRDVIRPNVFGNFRQMLEAVAMSNSMLFYLDNAASTATIPNENYARELMELHTMGRGAYFGKNPGDGDVSDRGFTDEDIVQASRALSGWTVRFGQNGAMEGSPPDQQVNYPDDGQFIYNSSAHNTKAGRCLGFDLSTIRENTRAQGQKVLDLVAFHPATGPFICGKLCRRIFGDNPPSSVMARAIEAWTNYKYHPNQIAIVLRAILLGGAEVGTGPCTKVRRPYERFIGMVRTTDTLLSPTPYWRIYLQDVNDSPFTWPTPDGRPDSNQFWLSTYAMVTAWDQLKAFSDTTSIKKSLVAQTPVETFNSPAAMVEYWVGRMIGYTLSDEAMKALTALATNAGTIPQEAATNPGVAANWEINFARDVIATIAAAPEFVLR